MSRILLKINIFLETIKIHPQGIVGDLDIQVAVTGYKTEVLDSVGAPLPTETIAEAPEPFKDDDEDYDYDYDEDGNFVVGNSNQGIYEEVSLTLETDPAIDSIYDSIKKKGA